DYSDDYVADPDIVIIRYADVLLMYAEAKIELNEIDQSVLNAMNTVRARAYKVPVNQTSAYPAIQMGSQAQLRTQLRFERRMELAIEGLRHMDLMRWRLAEISLNIPEYGLLDPALLRERVVNTGMWFFPGKPQIDENGLADLKPIADAGLLKTYVIRSFEPNKHYVWPIPTKDIIINPNLTQNPNY